MPHMKKTKSKVLPLYFYPLFLATLSIGVVPSAYSFDPTKEPWPKMIGPYNDNGDIAYQGMVMVVAKYQGSSGGKGGEMIHLELLDNYVKVGEADLNPFIGDLIQNAKITYNGMSYSVTPSGNDAQYIQGGFCASSIYTSCDIVYDLFRPDREPAAPVVTPPVVTPPPATVIPPNVPQVSLPANYDALCSEGYTGSIHHIFSIYYTMETYSTVMSDGTPTTAPASTPHVSETITNSCVLIPTQDTQTKTGSQTATCDSYYGVASGTYSGIVYKTGQYLTTYSSDQKNASTIFNVTSVDATSCVSEITKITQETKLESCPSGENGSITYTRYKATNTKGATVYPYGTDWTVFSNTCISLAVEDDTPVINSASTPVGLLGNIYLTSSNIQSTDELYNYLRGLSSQSWSNTETHKLTVKIDDLSSGEYDRTKVSNAISQFQSTVGKDNAVVTLVLPRSLDKLVGNGTITSDTASNKSMVLKDIKLVGPNAVITYVDLKSGSSIEIAKEKQATISVLGSNVDLSKISAE